MKSLKSLEKKLANIVKEIAAREKAIEDLNMISAPELLKPIHAMQIKEHQDELVYLRLEQKALEREINETRGKESLAK